MARGDVDECEDVGRGMAEVRSCLAPRREPVNVRRHESWSRYAFVVTHQVTNRSPYGWSEVQLAFPQNKLGASPSHLNHRSTSDIKPKQALG
jgi:hypothetical protein